MKKIKIGFSAVSLNPGRQGWSRGRLSKKLTSAIVTGLLFSYGHMMWTPTVFADNANITISTSSDYTSPTDPNATFINSGANAGTFYLAGSNNTLLIIPSTSGWVISDATTYPDSLGIMGDRSNAAGVTISGNTVTVGNTSNSNANIGKNVYGGYVSGSNSNANNNTVIIYNGTVSGTVQGGKSIQGNSDGNAATVYGGTIE
ncbi:hypothetical protein [Propionispora hippei]|uniref:Uncharacterized protein n=1 Tax=Propionispora hippei DSM 15287 TaxID=1123003 RepID=A0A1M6NTJ1_9FIRM|nr:hypothetical protein [Propionispora hippei]SHJ98922.1 hypothetical protein SAMN02745170_03860 [Propionispora hippei DSM 15287]